VGFAGSELFKAKRDQIVGRTEVAASRALALARNVLRVYTFTRFLKPVAREAHKCEAIFYAEQTLVKKREQNDFEPDAFPICLSFRPVNGDSWQ
jgi:hypothetical protein